MLIVAFAAALVVTASLATADRPFAEMGCPADGGVSLAYGLYNTGPGFGEETPEAAIRALGIEGLEGPGRSFEVRSEMEPGEFGSLISRAMIDGRQVGAFEISETEEGRFFVSGELYCFDADENPLADYRGGQFDVLFFPDRVPQETAVDEPPSPERLAEDSAQGVGSGN